MFVFNIWRSSMFTVFTQSYAGKYVPAISYYIHKQNPKAKVKINLRGMAIGDGLCDPELVCKPSPSHFFRQVLHFICHQQHFNSIHIRCWAVTVSSCTRRA